VKSWQWFRFKVCAWIEIPSRRAPLDRQCRSAAAGSSNWQGIIVPVGTPKAIIAFVHREIVGIMALPDVKERLTVLGFEPVAGTPEEFARHCRLEFTKWAKVIEASNIKAQ
jgi:tripartite-type tricarboxylate transporter receptor subunit TctC